MDLKAPWIIHTTSPEKINLISKRLNLGTPQDFGSGFLHYSGEDFYTSSSKSYSNKYGDKYRIYKWKNIRHKFKIIWI